MIGDLLSMGAILIFGIYYGYCKKEQKHNVFGVDSKWFLVDGVLRNREDPIEYVSKYETLRFTGINPQTGERMYRRCGYATPLDLTIDPDYEYGFSDFIVGLNNFIFGQTNK